MGLFDGVGMISRAASMLGYDEHVLCEKEPYQRSVLAKRFPGATVVDDVCELRGEDLGRVDLMHGGSPCQGFSTAGLGEALQDPRSRLIMEFIRLVGEARPRVVLIENVAVLRSRGLSVVIDALASHGYLCWWDCVPALAVGAPHLRDRVWITAVRWDDMPDLVGPVFKPAMLAKYPRAGALTKTGGLVYLEPSATIKASKEAMGAVRQPDGTTWLTRLDSPLFPTPSAANYGSNVGGAAIQLVRPRHSLESMARLGLFPTPVAGDARNGKNATAGRSEGSNHHSGTTFPDYVRLWPTAGARDFKDMALGDGAIGRRQLPEAVRDSLGEAQRLWPSPAAAVGSRGTGRSEYRAGGPTLRTAVDESLRFWPTPRASPNELRTTSAAPSHGVSHGNVLSGVVCDDERGEGRDVPPGSGSAGPLSPYWVEWLMGVPIGWTDHDLDDHDLIQLDWSSEHDLPRVAYDVPRRKERLICCGNACLWQIAYLRIKQAHEYLGIEED